MSKIVTTKDLSNLEKPGLGLKPFSIHLSKDDIQETSIIAYDDFAGQQLYVSENKGNGEYEVIVLTTSMKEHFDTKKLQKGIEYSIVSYPHQVTPYKAI